jgi:single-strand DNA-binding protein
MLLRRFKALLTSTIASTCSTTSDWASQPLFFAQVFDCAQAASTASIQFMANFNKVMLMGNVTRDIELRYTPKGTAVADIGLAVNRVRSGDNGEKIEETTFVDVTLWGRTAEVANQYSGKGKPLFVEGRLQTDSWDDKETGKKRSKLKVVADNIQLMGSPGGGGGGGNQNQQGGNSAPQQQPSQHGGSPAQSSGGVDENDDIPF